MEELIKSLQARQIRYSRDHGEPDPTPAFPVEVVFSIRDWARVELALFGLQNKELLQELAKT